MPLGAARAVHCEAEILADPQVVEACTGIRTASSDGISNTGSPTPTSADGNPTVVTKLTTRTGQAVADDGQTLTADALTGQAG
ncbi:hypothetical protein RHA1_ro08834 (plasmid) [Rhodococcus jostii RHA1]|uniref:Uncharacterized protein n=1 Tax=Rhodococcus jostii (strain RHA1) TaxID=101510 RepID=Q0RXV8_RHOJR|nr:hypothetical protein RHA1_ro08834 [Rhodococcus jostii RHA1]